MSETKGTPLAQVRGLGSAHHGSHHWLLQRYTAAGNLITAMFLAISLVLLPDLSFAVVRAWLAQPLPATLMALLVVSVFWHARLGLTVMIEDYVHDSARKFAVLLVLNLVVAAGIAFGLVCVLRIVLAALSEASAHDAVAKLQQAMQSASQGAPR
ncbi:MAG: succinate dehydrogenase, hydrophobic membrane anchor protein [Croceibacterium sp.]